MKILVTGSQGTLGLKLVEELKARNHEVWGADLRHGESNIIRADVSEARQVERLFEAVQPQACYHLAAEFGRRNGQDYYEQLWKTNCLGTRNVIDSCLKHNTQLIFASSSEAYGDLADDKTLYEGLLEDRAPHFHNEYSLSKWANERQIQIAMRNQGLNTVILRFFNVYGPGEFYSEYRSVVCQFIYNMLKGLPITVFKDARRSFLYMDDWSRTVANVVDRKGVDGEAFNIGSQQCLPIAELAAMLGAKLGHSEIKLFGSERANVANKSPDTGKAERMLGHKETVSLSDGLDKTIQWMRLVYA